MTRLNQIAGLAVGCMFAAAAMGQQAMPPIPSAPDLLPKEAGPAPSRQFEAHPDDCSDEGNLVELLGVSELVFDGALVGKTTFTPPGMRILVTEYTFRVHEWIKGAGGETVTVRETGGTEPDGSGMASCRSHRLEMDGRYLVYGKQGRDGLMFPFDRVIQVLDNGATLADEQGRIAIGMRQGDLITRVSAQARTLSYLGTSPVEQHGAEDHGPPHHASEPMGAQPEPTTTPDNGPIGVEAVLSVLRTPGTPAPAGRPPAGLPSGGMDYNYCGYVTGATGARNFATWLPDDDNFNWFNSAELDWDNLTTYSGAGGWIFGYLTSGGNPIRNEAPVANNNRDNGGVPSSAQMTAGGYGSWAANGNPNGICFFWFTGGNCTRIRESDVFVNPVNGADELQFRKSIVHEMGHSIGFGHENRFVSIMVSGTWRVPPNYVLGSYYNRADECMGGRAMLVAANGNGGTWNIRNWRDIATVSQAHPNYGNAGDVGPNVTTLNDFNAASGDVVQIQRMFVENRGNTAYSGDVDLRIYLSSNTTISSGDHLVWSGGWGSFGANSVSNNFNLNMTIPQSIPTGDYYIGWILTAAEAELTSNNNTGIMVADSTGNYAPRTIHITQRPANNDCADAIVIGNGTTPFSTVGATTDGPAEPGCSFCCGDTQVNQDIWFRYTATCTGTVTVSLCGSGYDTKVAVYGAACPGGPGTAIACNDDATCSGAATLQSRTTFAATSGTRYLIRVGGYTTNSGTGTIAIGCAGCYADCDLNGALNVNDFICFQAAFAATAPYADCDHNNAFNVNDFICFQSAFAAGCP